MSYAVTLTINHSHRYMFYKAILKINQVTLYYFPKRPFYYHPPLS